MPGWTGCREEEETLRPSLLPHLPSLPPSLPPPPLPPPPARAQPPSLFLRRGCRVVSQQRAASALLQSQLGTELCERSPRSPGPGAASGSEAGAPRSASEAPIRTQRSAEPPSRPAGRAGEASGRVRAQDRGRQATAASRGQRAECRERPGAAEGVARPEPSSPPGTPAPRGRGPRVPRVRATPRPTAGGVPLPALRLAPPPAGRPLAAGACEREAAGGREDRTGAAGARSREPRAAPGGVVSAPERAPLPGPPKFDTRVPAVLGTRRPSWIRVSHPLQSFPRRNRPSRPPPRPASGGSSRADPGPCAEGLQPVRPGVALPACLRAMRDGFRVAPPHAGFSPIRRAPGLAHPPDPTPSLRISRREAEPTCAHPAWGSGPRDETQVWGVEGQPRTPSHGSRLFSPRTSRAPPPVCFPSRCSCSTPTPTPTGLLLSTPTATLGCPGEPLHPCFVEKQIAPRGMEMRRGVVAPSQRLAIVFPPRAFRT